MTYGDNSKPKAQTKEYDDKYPQIDWSNSPSNIKEEKKCKKKKKKK